MANIGSLIVSVVADTGKFKSGLKGASSSMGSFRKSLGGLSTGFAGLGVAMTAGGVIAGMKKMVGLARVQEQAEKKLAAVLAATGNAAGFTAKQLGEYASSLQDITNVGDEATLEVMSILATFKEIKGDQFKDVTKAALDMSAVLGTSATSAAVQLGKALNDPTTGLTALTRAGVSFTESQKDMIKSLQESGDMMGAQKLILAELESEFGGAAEALADPWIQFQNSLGDLGEEIGANLIPYLNQLGEAGKESLKTAGGELSWLETGFGKVADVVGVAVDSFGFLQVALSGVSLIVVSAMSRIVTAIAAVIDYIPGLSGSLDDLKKDLDLRAEGMKLTVEEDWDAAMKGFNDQTPSAKAAAGLRDIEEAAKAAEKAMAGAGGEMATKSRESGGALLDKLGEKLAGMTGGDSLEIENALADANLDLPDDEFADFSQSINEVTGKLLEAEIAAKKLEDATKATASADSMIEPLKDPIALEGGLAPTDLKVRKPDKLGEKLAGMTGDIALDLEIENALADAKLNLPDDEFADFAQSISEVTGELLEAKIAADKLKEATQAAATADSMIESLKDSIALEGGLDPTDLKVQKLEEQGMTTGKGLEIKMLTKELEKAKKLTDDMDLGKSLANQFRTPLEEFKKTAEDLDRLLGVGAIDAATAQRAFDAAQDTLAGSVESAVAPDVFAGRADVGSAEAYRIMSRAQAGGAAANPQEKLVDQGKAQINELKNLNSVIGKGVEKLEPPQVAETPP